MESQSSSSSAAAAVATTNDCDEAKRAATVASPSDCDGVVRYWNTYARLGGDLPTERSYGIDTQWGIRLPLESSSTLSETLVPTTTTSSLESSLTERVQALVVRAQRNIQNTVDQIINTPSANDSNKLLARRLHDVAMAMAEKKKTTSNEERFKDPDPMLQQIATMILNHRTRQLMLTAKRVHYHHDVDDDKDQQQSSVPAMDRVLSLSKSTMMVAWPSWPLIYQPLNATISYFSDIPLFSVERSLAWPFINNHIQLPPLTSLVATA
jgi:hypothetical protein